MVLRGSQNQPRGPARCSPSPDGTYSLRLCLVSYHRAVAFQPRFFSLPRRFTQTCPSRPTLRAMAMVLPDAERRFVCPIALTA
jgi:hypothetical protein